MKKIRLAITSLLMGVTLSHAQVHQHSSMQCHTIVPEDEPEIPLFQSEGTTSSCSSIRHMKVNIHYLLKSDGTGNFTPTSDGWGNSSYTGYDYAEDMVSKVNEHLAVNDGVWLPANNTLPAHDFGFRILLNEVLFHENDQVFNTQNVASYSFNGLNLISSSTNHEIDVYFVNKPVDSGYHRGFASVSTSNPRMVQLNTWYSYHDDNQSGVINSVEARTFAHEIAHTLGLYHHTHAASDDGCTDTPINNQCWVFDPNVANCDSWSEVSNNLMTYNAYDSYALSPCQINKIANYVDTHLSDFVYQCSDCMPAKANMYLPETQCLPLLLDGTATQGETRHFIEIYEVPSLNSTTVLPNTYYAAWHEGEIGKIHDLGSYTGYTFEHGRVYRIKLAAQKDLGTSFNGQFCTNWDEVSGYVTINDAVTCCTQYRQLTPFYDKDGDCIIGFSVGVGCDQSFVDNVTFNLNGNITVDNQYTYFYHMPSNAAFTGNISATINYADGTSKVLSTSYQKCATQVLDPIDDKGPVGPLDGFLKTSVKDELPQHETITIYPNPTHGPLVVHIAGKKVDRLTLYSIRGSKVKTIPVQQGKNLIDITDLPKGVYFIHHPQHQGNVGIQKIVLH